jgi:threonine aldolase
MLPTPAPTGPIDLRSDTVTKPTPAMLQAMLEAPVGDDVYGEDPSINALQAQAAALLGFEAGMFMPSGTMTNQVAIAVHTQRGQEVVCTEGAHIYEYELGMMAAFSGVIPRFVPAPLGAPDPEGVRKAVRHSIHQSPTGLIALENTHNVAGGTVLPLETLAAVREIADAEGLPLHLDGARVFNAAAAQNVNIREIARHFHSVSICLSKGLGAPVGSVLLGSNDFIGRAHRYRKMMGGGMRQAGILAAAGSHVLEHGPARLPADHARAKRFAHALHDAGWGIDLQSVQTNMIYAHVPDAARRCADWAAQGVLAGALYADKVRFVFHFQISDDDLERALDVVLGRA